MCDTIPEETVVLKAFNDHDMKRNLRCDATVDTLYYSVQKQQSKGVLGTNLQENSYAEVWF